MVLGRRLLVLLALFFWQGGGAFYGAVAIPIGRRILADQASLQSVITRDVTRWLNWCGVVALALLALDLLGGDGSFSRRTARFVCWLIMALCQAALFSIHAQLGLVYRGSAIVIGDHDAFHVYHRLYLLATTAQFAAALAFLTVTLIAWHAMDAQRARF
jgi:hypothetical protein